MPTHLNLLLHTIISSVSMPTSFLSLLAICLLLLFQGSLGKIERRAWHWQGRKERKFREQRECSVERLSALEPTRRVESEAGVIEYWDEKNAQLKCVGVAATRQIIQPRGLHLPSFTNAPSLIYIVQGRGVISAVFPGCPETFQYSPHSQQCEREQRQRYRDQHQKILYFRRGDIITLPAGVAYWTYNDGEDPVVGVSVLDTSSNANHLDQNLRKFNLAGRLQRQFRWSYEHEPRLQVTSKNNIFNGFDVQSLAKAFGVSMETARKLQNPEDKRGEIVSVKDGLEIGRPPRREEEEEEGRWNGLEETLCNRRLKQNIVDPTHADVYSPQGGLISSLNSQKLPILKYLQMSAERGVLYRNALLAPHWNMNAHSVVYVTRGNARIQIVNNKGKSVFDGEVHQGQLVIVPQMFAVLKEAGNEGFEWVSFKTNDNTMISPLAGKASVFGGMPENVLINSYKISRAEARRLKYNRGEEMMVFAPWYRSEGWASL
ncbi:cocosin 1-like [Tasmannia lanceolata]|uniref:cocosin 1-like n=1 Tax=Tasmannia lanceolata TaxID=3420 RepID=UPI004063EE8A